MYSGPLVFSHQPIIYRAGIELFDEALYFTRTDIDEAAAHEGIGGLTFLALLELLQPGGQAPNEAHPGLEIAVAVVFQARHESKPLEFFASTLVIPVHDLAQDLESEVLVHRNASGRNRNLPSTTSSASR